MDILDIDKILCSHLNTKHIYKGIHTKLPKMNKNELILFYIEDGDIGHVIAIYKKTNTEILFFDSLGQQPSSYGINLVSPLTMNFALQSNKSCLCSLFTLYFCLHCVFGDFETIFLRFSKTNTYLNAGFIINWSQKYFPKLKDYLLLTCEND